MIADRMTVDLANVSDEVVDTDVRRDDVFIENLIVSRNSKGPLGRPTSMTDKPTADTLRQAKCVPCEGGVPIIEAARAADFLKATPQWSLDPASKMISRSVDCKNFVAAMALFNQIAEVAEQQQHHPDLHLTGYRKVRIDLTTHAIGGLSENDFIVAAKIDQILTG